MYVIEFLEVKKAPAFECVNLNCSEFVSYGLLDEEMNTTGFPVGFIVLSSSELTPYVKAISAIFCAAPVFVSCMFFDAGAGVTIIEKLSS